MKKYKRGEGSDFVGLARKTINRECECQKKQLVECYCWKSLSLRAKVVYISIKARFNGKNNGEIELAYSKIAGQPGFRTPRGFYSAVDELVKKGWIERIKGGGLFKNPSKYKLTGRFDDYRIDG